MNSQAPRRNWEKTRNWLGLHSTACTGLCKATAALRTKILSVQRHGYLSNVHVSKYTESMGGKGPWIQWKNTKTKPYRYRGPFLRLFTNGCYLSASTQRCYTSLGVLILICVIQKFVSPPRFQFVAGSIADHACLSLTRIDSSAAGFDQTSKPVCFCMSVVWSCTCTASFQKPCGEQLCIFGHITRICPCLVSNNRWRACSSNLNGASSGNYGAISMVTTRNLTSAGRHSNVVTMSIAEPESGLGFSNVAALRGWGDNKTKVCQHLCAWLQPGELPSSLRALKSNVLILKQPLLFVSREINL